MCDMSGTCWDSDKSNVMNFFQRLLGMYRHDKTFLLVEVLNGQGHTYHVVELLNQQDDKSRGESLSSRIKLHIM
jgi:hypothetical protein